MAEKCGKEAIDRTPKPERQSKNNKERPPLLNLDNLGKKPGKAHSIVKEELEEEFEEAGNWVGIRLTIEELQKYIWCKFRKQETDQTLLFAHRYDKDRRETIAHKIEKFLWIHSSQVEILEYYMTNRNGIIAWMKLDRRMQL